MRIRILGCSGGIGGGSRTTAMLIDDDVLLDAGTGIGDLALGDLASIRHVFLTHAHLDHIAGLPMLVDAIFTDAIDDPLVVHGRAETLAALREHIFNDVIWPDFSVLPTPESSVVRFEECRPGDTVRVGHRAFHAIDVAHTVPAVGYTVKNSCGVLAVSGDTRTNRTLWPVLNACDDLRALVIEVSFPNENEELADVSGHYCPHTLSRDLKRLEPDPDIWLTGMKPGEEARILSQVREAIPDRRVQMLTRGAVIQL